jgi:hypothetical protein
MMFLPFDIGEEHAEDRKESVESKGFVAGSTNGEWFSWLSWFVRMDGDEIEKRISR